VVLGCGNPSRGDDALGPALLDRVEEWLRLHPDRRVVALGDFQLQVEHTLDPTPFEQLPRGGAKR
jgi:Ni,Fe-hydrogenase maturation factor